MCHGNVLSYRFCVTLGTVGLRTCESWLDEFCTDTEITLKWDIYDVFGFLFARDIWSAKDDIIVEEESLCTCFMDTTVHHTELCTFWTSQTFVSGKLDFFLHNA